MGNNVKQISLSELLAITTNLLSNIKVPVSESETITAPIMMAVKNLNVGIQAATELEKKLQEYIDADAPVAAEPEEVEVEQIEGPEEGDNVVELGEVPIPVDTP